MFENYFEDRCVTAAERDFLLYDCVSGANRAMTSIIRLCKTSGPVTCSVQGCDLGAFFDARV